MGNLTDLILGTEAELAAVDPTEIPINVLPGIDIKRIDLVELANLYALTTGTDFDAGLDAFLPVSGEESEEGPWVFRFPDVLIEALTSANPNELQRITAAWADTEGVRRNGWSEVRVAERIDTIRAFVARAKATGKPVHVWMSL